MSLERNFLIGGVSVGAALLLFLIIKDTNLAHYGTEQAYINRSDAEFDKNQAVLLKLPQGTIDKLTARADEADKKLKKVEADAAATLKAKQAQSAELERWASGEVNKGTKGDAAPTDLEAAYAAMHKK